MTSGQRVLVTGATGFVGNAVARAMADAGYRVTATVRSPAAGQLAGLGADLVVADMRDPASYLAAAEQADVVVHAAQQRIAGRVTRRKLASLGRANTTMTATLAAACLRTGARLIYTSGAFVYGDHGEEWISEDTPFRPSPLGAAHAQGVGRLRALRSRGLDYVVLTLGFVYGPGGLFKTVFYDQAARGRLRCIGRGANLWSIVHVQDAAAAYLAAARHGRPGEEYNVADGSPLRLRTFLDELTDAMGRRRVGNAPVAAAALLAGRPAIASLTTSYRVSTVKVRAELGWRPLYPSAAEGIPAVLAALSRAERANLPGARIAGE